MAVTLYTLDQLSHRYHRRVVLDIPHLEFAEGAIYTLEGPNGAGKTTLLHILAFLRPPTAGTVFYQGRKVAYTKTGLHKLRQNVVLLNQHPLLFSTSVAKNIAFGLKIRGLGSKERQKRVAAALDLVGMRSFAKAPARSLSGGETQRVALAQALVLNPKVFLCDEPTANVDKSNQTAITTLLKRICQENGTTVIVATHDHRQALQLTTQSFYLDHGRLTPFPDSSPFRSPRQQCCA